MRYVVCSVFDKATAAYGQPFCVKAVGEASRMLSNEVNSGKQDSNIVLHPDHFQLYALGTFDDSSGLFAPANASGPDFVLECASLVVKPS